MKTLFLVQLWILLLLALFTDPCGGAEVSRTFAMIKPHAKDHAGMFRLFLGMVVATITDLCWETGRRSFLPLPTFLGALSMCFTPYTGTLATTVD